MPVRTESAANPPKQATSRRGPSCEPTAGMAGPEAKCRIENPVALCRLTVMASPDARAPASKSRKKSPPRSIILAFLTPAPPFPLWTIEAIAP